jgi:uncharacterized protein (DUF608 family)
MVKSGPNADVVHYNATRRDDHQRRMAAVRRYEADQQAKAAREQAEAWYDISTTLTIRRYSGNLLASKLQFLTSVYEIALDMIDAAWARHIAGGTS